MFRIWFVTEYCTVFFTFATSHSIWVSFDNFFLSESSLRKTSEHCCIVIFIAFTSIYHVQKGWVYTACVDTEFRPFQLQFCFSVLLLLMLFFARANLLQKNCTDSNKLQNLLVTAENVKVCLRWRDPLLNCSSILAVTQTLYALINDFHSPFDLLRFDNKRCFVFEIKTQWVWPVFNVCSCQTNTRPTEQEK